MTSTSLPVASRPMPTWVLPTVLTVLRVAAGLMFMQHGAQKLFGVLGGPGGSGEAVPLLSLMGFGGAVEFFGGLLIALGLFTRPMAALAAVQMIAAYFMAHAPQGGLPVQNQGELALLYAAVFAALVGLGAGPWSLDALLFSKKR